MEAIQKFGDSGFRWETERDLMAKDLFEIIQKEHDEMHQNGV